MNKIPLIFTNNVDEAMDKLTALFLILFTPLVAVVFGFAQFFATFYYFPRGIWREFVSKEKDI